MEKCIIDGKKLIMEGTTIMFRNFAGRPTPFDPVGGKRRFCIPLLDNEAELLASAGCNIKYLKPKTDEDQPVPYVSAIVNYGPFPPRIWSVINVNGKRNVTALNPDTVSILDHANIQNCDIILSMSSNKYKQGQICLYVDQMYAVIQNDYFADKYAIEEDDDDDVEIPFA